MNKKDGTKNILKRSIPLALVFTIVSPLFAFFGGLNFDPVAKMQRVILITEQKIQTLKAIQVLQETIKNVRTAERMYEMSKRGYEKLKDPNEWKALENFAKRRMQLLLDPDVDPYDSSLMKIFNKLDSALDNYIASIDNLRWLTAKLDSADNRVAGWMDSIPFIGRLEKGEKWANDVNAHAYAKRYGSPETMILTAETNVRTYEKELEKLKLEEDRMKNDSEKLNRALYAAHDSFTQSRYDMENKWGQDGEGAAKLNAFQVRKATLDQVQREKETMEKRKAELISRSVALAEKIMTGKEQNERTIALLGFQGTLKESWVKISISSMADLSNYMESVQLIFFALLVISLAMGILWYGLGFLRGGSNDLPHEVLIGFLAAFVFLFPQSPLSMHKVAKTLAVSVDGLTAIVAKESGNPVNMLNTVFQNTMGAYNQVELEKINRWQDVGGSVTKFGGSIMNAVFTSVWSFLFGLIGFAVSLFGSVAVFGSLLFRNLIFWVLMILSPAFIFMAPLSYGRRRLIPAWGAVTYGTVLWGPVIHILLMVSNVMIQKMAAIACGTYTASPLTDLFLNAFSGFILTAAMVVAPLMVLGIAMGSFGGMTSVLGALSANAVGAGSGLVVSGGGLAVNGTGKSISLSGGLVSKCGKGLSRMGFEIGRDMQVSGQKISNIGAAVSRSSVYLSSLGANIVMRNLGLHKILPRTGKEKGPGNKGANGGKP